MLLSICGNVTNVVKSFSNWRGSFNKSEINMRIKMKRCLTCKTLLSNSSKVCTKCGSKELEKGVYTDEYNESVIFNKHLNESRSDISLCSLCAAPVIHGKCSVCDD
jgi:hypothetical protein